MDDDAGGAGPARFPFDDRLQMFEQSRKIQTPQERFVTETETFISNNHNLASFQPQVSKLYSYIKNYYYHNPAYLYLAYYYLTLNELKIDADSFNDYINTVEFYGMVLQKSKTRTRERVNITSKPDFLRYVRLVKRAVDESTK